MKSTKLSTIAEPMDIHRFTARFFLAIAVASDEDETEVDTAAWLRDVRGQFEQGLYRNYCKP